MKNTVMTVMVAAGAMVLMVGSAKADTTILQRVDCTSGQKSGYSIGVMTPKLEVWAFGANSANPTLEIGQLRVVHSDKNSVALVGGYVSRWGNGKVYAEPFAIIKQSFGKVQLTAKPFAYLPLGGGSAVLGSDEISASYEVRNGIRLGFASKFWCQGGTTTISSGPTVSVQKGNTNFSLRFTGKDESSSFRFQLTQSF